MKIAYASDLHLDFHLDGGEEFIRTLDIPDCDLFVIAGDLSQADHWRWKQNVKEICNKTKQVLYVLGNHCYYSSTITEVDCLAHKLPEEVPNLIVASRAKVLTNKDIECLGEMSLLAGTMWFQDFPDQDQYKQYLSDFTYISDIEPEIYRRNTRFDILLHGIKDEPSIVVSHHMPSYCSVNPKYRASAINRFFVGAEFFDAIKDSKIKCWIAGHGHDQVSYEIGNTKIVANPLGYPNEISVNWAVKVIDIDV